MNQEHQLAMFEAWIKAQVEPIISNSKCGCKICEDNYCCSETRRLVVEAYRHGMSIGVTMQQDLETRK